MIFFVQYTQQVLLKRISNQAGIGNITARGHFLLHSGISCYLGRHIINFLYDRFEQQTYLSCVFILLQQFIAIIMYNYCNRFECNPLIIPSILVFFFFLVDVGRIYIINAFLLKITNLLYLYRHFYVILLGHKFNLFRSGFLVLIPNYYTFFKS